MVYAVIETGGKQYVVKPGQTIRVEKIDIEEGETIRFDKVYLVKPDDEKASIRSVHEGLGFEVTGTLVRQERGRKITVFKKRRKETYKRKQGHRQDLSVIRIETIQTKATKEG